QPLRQPAQGVGVGGLGHGLGEGTGRLGLVHAQAQVGDADHGNAPSGATTNANPPEGPAGACAPAFRRISVSAARVRSGRFLCGADWQSALPRPTPSELVLLYRPGGRPAGFQSRVIRSETLTRASCSRRIAAACLQILSRRLSSWLPGFFWLGGAPPRNCPPSA